MTDDELIDNLRIVLIASRGSTGRGLRAELARLITTTTLASAAAIPFWLAFVR